MGVKELPIDRPRELRYIKIALFLDKGQWASLTIILGRALTWDAPSFSSDNENERRDVRDGKPSDDRDVPQQRPVADHLVCQHEGASDLKSAQYDVGQISGGFQHSCTGTCRHVKPSGSFGSGLPSSKWTLHCVGAPKTLNSRYSPVCGAGSPGR